MAHQHVRQVVVAPVHDPEPHRRGHHLRHARVEHLRPVQLRRSIARVSAVGAGRAAAQARLRAADCICYACVAQLRTRLAPSASRSLSLPPECGPPDAPPTYTAQKHSALVPPAPIRHHRPPRHHRTSSAPLARALVWRAAAPRPATAKQPASSAEAAVSAFTALKALCCSALTAPASCMSGASH